MVARAPSSSPRKKRTSAPRATGISVVVADASRSTVALLDTPDTPKWEAIYWFNSLKANWHLLWMVTGRLSKKQIENTFTDAMRTKAQKLGWENPALWVTFRLHDTIYNKPVPDAAAGCCHLDDIKKTENSTLPTIATLVYVYNMDTHHIYRIQS